MGLRFIRFNAVGLGGFALQLAVLAIALAAGIHYLAATALAVESAVLHNFLWHERWTWRDRPVSGRARLVRLARFHLLNGLVSLTGNLALMRLLVGAWGMAAIPANLIAVGICSTVNFLASDRVVFDDKTGTAPIKKGGCPRFRRLSPFSGEGQKLGDFRRRAQGQGHKRGLSPF